MNGAQAVFTIGHSNRSTEDFDALLRDHGIRRLVDVRRFPGSRRYPQFGSETLAKRLAAVGVAYAHEPDMGGRRPVHDDSPNTAWRVAGFRGYADHTDSPEFRSALERLLRAAAESPTAIMCAEALFWRCHRQLIADALVARGTDVLHILDPDDVRPHSLNPHARVLEGSRLIYPAAPPDQPDLF